MASPGPSSAPAIRSTRRLAPAAPNAAGVLPPDLLFDVLLRLPAKELCRLRAVCRSWRSLTSDPLFAGAHAARHPGPLLLAKFRDDEARVHIVDLSGSVVKRIAGPDGHELLCTRLHLACVASKGNSCHVLDPATGAAYALPESPAPEHVNHENSRDPYTFFASGRVASTGECKVLRVFNRTEFDAFDQQQLFEVFTINGGVSNAQWRARQSHYLFVEANNAAVVGGVVYFLTDCAYDLMLFFGVNTGIHPDCIASFDLGTEEWRRDIQGPISSGLSMDGANATEEYRSIWHKLTLSELKGSLVLAYHRRHQSLDLWLLTDFERGLWVKEYSIQTESAIPADEYFVKPLLVSDDGRLVIFLASTGLLLIYDPRTNSFSEVEMRRLDAVGLYTGNLLSLQGGDIV
ncbi:hypothetical protein PAHAL_2G072900 [Panicum hallii]|jgi:F-box interacting protein|uniref:F-box domain-containing protein n=1 Tax=Panicum hallii TaxID=206008 RepID=A0A2S3GWJ1_9POAL|nr:putative F-box protein At5g52610 [Panicum hallii]XP_025802078.1 putative F-box protein At5g52610 [Panicum hallii]PAN10124.1 hypothetical protein PAHAL_2G072900 [Panicum hallii]PVH63630.1 hypothetical protein PAHAL_2G072900 [Panicum hallii]